MLNISHNETGLTVTPGDAAQLKDALYNMLHNEPQRLRFSQAAVARVDKDFNDAVVLHKLDEFVLECEPGAPVTAQRSSR